MRPVAPSFFACAAAALLFPTNGFAPPPQTSALVEREKVMSSTAVGALTTATFGTGCFWAPAETLRKSAGVIDAVAGYTGRPDYAKVEGPKYDNVCFGRGWVEAVRVTYDDDVVSYDGLLDAFFQAQEPKPGSRQYASVIFPFDKEQMRSATDWLEEGKRKDLRREKDGLSVAYTTIEAPSRFFMAEGYHQKYWEKWRVRFVIGPALLAVASGALTQFLPVEDGIITGLADKIETTANGVLVAGGLAAVLERYFDTKVVEL